MGGALGAAAPTGGPQGGFFEGTEKRVEVDFSLASGCDLRSVKQEDWAEVVRLSQTTIIGKKETANFTSFLLSESSLVVYPSKVILKTCGRTVPLASIPKILELAKGVGMEPEWLCYSRKNFLAPSQQPTEHQSSQTEIELCKKACGIGDAYILGPLTGEHWLLYNAEFKQVDSSVRGDLTVDMMMYGLPEDVRNKFYSDKPEGSREGAEEMTNGSGLGAMAETIGGDVDDYCFAPCGYSCNAHAGDTYFITHVTPEEACSYASFETNFGSSGSGQLTSSAAKPLNDLIRRVLEVFKPERFTMTLFIDSGALEAIGDAPWAAPDMAYQRANTNSYHFETDYIATVGNFYRLGEGESPRKFSTPTGARGLPVSTAP